MSITLEERILNILKAGYDSFELDVQKIMVAIQINYLPPQQQLIYFHITGELRSTGAIAKELGMPSKNVSKQLEQIYSKTSLIEMWPVGNRKHWKIKNINL